MAGQTITVSVLADTKKFSSAMRNLGDTSGLSKLGGGIKNVGMALGASVVAVGAVGAAWAASTLQSLANIERIGAQTNAVLASTGGAAGRTRAQIDSLANSIEDLSGIEGETITEGQNLLLTFTGIKDTNFDRATQTMADMAVALNKGSLEGLDMKTTATQLGKALNDPINGISTLTRVGVTFTDQQKEQIKAMTEAGDVAGAQTVILDELNKEFGGSAAAAGETTIGVFKRVKNAFEEVSEKLLARLLPVIKRLADWLLNTGVPMFEKYAKIVAERVKPVLKDLADWWETTGKPGLEAFSVWLKDEVLPRLQDLADRLKTDVLPRLEALAKWITGTLIPGIRTFVSWIIKNRDWLASLGVAIGTVVLAVKAYQTAMALWRIATIAATAVQAAFNIVMSLNPVSLIVLAIAALVAGLIYFFTQTETGKKVWAALTEAFKKGWEWIKDAFAKGVEFVKWYLQTAWDFIKKVWGYSPLGMVIANWDAITAAFATAVETVKGWLQTAWDFIKLVWSYSPLGMIVTNWDAIIAFFKEIPTKVRNTFLNAVGWLVNAGNNIIQGLRDGITTKWNEALAWVRGIGNLVKEGIGNLSTKLLDAGKQLIEGLKSGIESAARGLADKVLNPVKDAVNGVKKFLGIKSPSRLFRAIGENTIDGLALGLRDVAAIDAAMRDVNGSLVAGIDVSPTIANAARTATGNTYNININTGVGDPVAIGREVSAALAAYERVNGGRR